MLIPQGAPLPITSPTTSYWQIPKSRLRNHRTTPELPAEADYVIVGGGISGSSLAFRLLERQPKAKVLLLEARDACSGASGRNGGHCRPGRYTTIVRDTALHGPLEAAAIARFEERNVRDLPAFTKSHKINCTLESVTTVDLYETGTEFLLRSALAAVAARKVLLAKELASGDVDARTIHSAEEAKRKFGTSKAIGAVSFPAYSINPYRFVCGVLELALEKGLNLQTSTPVTSISSHDGIWTVSTSRGDIFTKNILLATNAYTSHLLPQASKFIMPVRNQALAVQSGSSIAKTDILENHSICFRYTTEQEGVFGDDYMVAKPHNPSLSASFEDQRRDIVIGGARHLAPRLEEWNTDDSRIDPDISTYLSSTLQNNHFSTSWGKPGTVLKEWTGIVGHTPDENPILGPVPGKPGLWICAGFTGHGMALAFRSAEAVAGLVAGDESVREWVPGSFLCGRKGCEILPVRATQG